MEKREEIKMLTPSDIKKIIQWYNLLEKHNMLNFEDADKSADEEE
jgi:hypothetical protein